MSWLRPLEAGIILALWIVLVFVSCKFVSVLYHEVQGGNDEYRDEIALAAHLEMKKLESEMN